MWQHALFSTVQCSLSWDRDVDMPPEHRSMTMRTKPEAVPVGPAALARPALARPPPLGLSRGAARAAGSGLAHLSLIGTGCQPPPAAPLPVAPAEEEGGSTAPGSTALGCTALGSMPPSLASSIMVV